MGVAMADTGMERRWHEVARFRLMVDETTTALGLDIVLDLEGDLNELVDVEAQGLPQLGERHERRVGV
jgi:hypothetical protein